MAFPSQTPNYQQRQRKKTIRIVVMAFAAMGGLAVGILVLDKVAWLGVTIVGLSVLMPAIFAIKGIVTIAKDIPLQEPGTIDLLTVASDYCFFDECNQWEITSEMWIRLDNGHTARGTYVAHVRDEPLREWWWRAFPRQPGRLKRRISPKEALDAWFHVGARVRCLYNPMNPDAVVAYPFAAAGDRMAESVFRADGVGRVYFSSV